MAQKYYVDNLISRFIKCLLWDTYVPTVAVWKPGRSLIKGLTYVTDDKYIVVAKNDYISGQGESPKSALDDKYFQIISPFIPNKFYRGVTSNFESNSALYDPDTHYALGQYLRYLRDMENLNLMPYYNCYSGESSDRIRIKEKNNKEYIELNNEIEDGQITYIVPIKLNQTYSIYYESNIPFKVLPAYYDGIQAAQVKDTKGNLLHSITVNHSCRKHPYIFDSINMLGKQAVFEDTSARLLEDYLVLLIQVPKLSLSNLVVLEGNYETNRLDLNNKNGESSINRLTPIHFGDLSKDTANLNRDIKVVPSLTFELGNTNYAFSDRLIEYLLYSPIINRDKIRYNIKRVQDYLSSSKAEKELGTQYKETFVQDIWDDNLRAYIYNLVIGDSKTPLYKDINGFVDKDSEFIIDRAKIDGGKFNVWFNY